MGTEGEGLGTGLGTGSGAGAEFFGIRARGQRFAYVVDISGSMGQNGRLELALGELVRSLAALPDFPRTLPPCFWHTPPRGSLRSGRRNIHNPPLCSSEFP